ncbi:MAG TPA: hypothetical protein VIB07_04680 [Nitrososphaera sp.]|jgi:hypothetical protein
MARGTRRTATKTLIINKGRDFVVDRLIEPCEENNHSKCTGWAVIKKEQSLVNANYFLRCTCKCHKKVAQIRKKKHQPKRRKTVKKHKPKRRSRKSRTGKKSRKR